MGTVGVKSQKKMLRFTGEEAARSIPIGKCKGKMMYLIVNLTAVCLRFVYLWFICKEKNESGDEPSKPTMLSSQKTAHLKGVSGVLVPFIILSVENIPTRDSNRSDVPLSEKISAVLIGIRILSHVQTVKLRITRKVK